MDSEHRQDTLLIVGHSTLHGSSSQFVNLKGKNKRLKQMVPKRRCCVQRLARRHSRGVKQCVKVSVAGGVKPVDQGSGGLHSCSSARMNCTLRFKTCSGVPTVSTSNRAFHVRRLDNRENTNSESGLHVTLTRKEAVTLPTRCSASSHERDSRFDVLQVAPFFRSLRTVADRRDNSTTSTPDTPEYEQ